MCSRAFHCYLHMLQLSCSLAQPDTNLLFLADIYMREVENLREEQTEHRRELHMQFFVV